MINWLWLFLIVPVSGCIGVAFMALIIGGSMGEKNRQIFLDGFRKGVECCEKKANSNNLEAEEDCSEMANLYADRLRDVLGSANSNMNPINMNPINMNPINMNPINRLAQAGDKKTESD